MNYYPNYYMSYPYNNYTQPGAMPQQVQMPMTQLTQPNMPPQQNMNQVMTGLNGKIVDGEDVVKATEVPIGGYGIFPKADLSEIYLKSWNNNGTTSIITFKPIVEEKGAGGAVQGVTTLDDVIAKIDALEYKITNLAVQTAEQPRVKEESKDAFKL